MRVASDQIYGNKGLTQLPHDRLKRIAGHLKDVGRAQSRFAVLQPAWNPDMSPELAKEIFWAALDAQSFEIAERCIDIVAAEEGGQAAWPERARRMLDNRRPIDIQELIKRMARRPATTIARADGPLCYVLAGSLPQMTSGYAMRSHHLLQALAKTEFPVHCMTRPGFPVDVPGQDAQAAVPVISRVDGVEYHRILVPNRKELKQTPYLEGARRALMAEFARLKPFAVMAASNHANAAPALLAARALGLPFIYDVRGFWELSRLSDDPAFGETEEFRSAFALEGAVAAHADLIFTLTEPMREELVRRGASADRIRLLPNGCDPAQFVPRLRDADLEATLGIPADVPVIGYVGSFWGYEGLDDLIRACGMLRRRGVAFRLVLVGDAPSQVRNRAPITPELKARITQEGLDDWSFLPGRVPADTVEAWYSLIDIAPFPRKPLPVTELVSPMKPLEAMSMAKTVVVSSVGALAEMVSHNETGLVFAKGDCDALADTLETALRDPALRRRLGQAARRRVITERSWDRIARNAIRELEQFRISDAEKILSER